MAQTPVNSEANAQATLHAKFQVQATPEGARAAAQWLWAQAPRMAVPRSAIERLDICLAEALANIISHAQLAPNAQAIDLSLQRSASASSPEVALKIWDRGTAFDPIAAVVRPLASDLQDATPGGLGLVMMRSNADALSYQREGGRNGLTITVAWTQAS